MRVAGGFPTTPTIVSLEVKFQAQELLAQAKSLLIRAKSSSGSGLQQEKQ
jgi:hypothetical protein